MRVLLSEGSSTSAREAVTALGLMGHRVEVCDPDAFCIARYSRFTRYRRCPGLRDDPDRFLGFVLDLVQAEKFDVLLPIHEQGFLFSRHRERLAEFTGIALPDFDAYVQLFDKAAFSRLLSELGLSQPQTTILAGPRDLVAGDASAAFPFVVKAAVGTASRGTFVVRTTADLQSAALALEQAGGAGEVLVQAFAEGALEHAQAVFDEGRLVGFHAYAQVARGAGGGDAIKASVGRAGVRADLARIGEVLRWHGAFTVDYLRGEGDGGALYIDGNPRLVEPLGAALCGVDLLGQLLAVSRGEHPEPLPEAREGVRTHLSIQAMLGHVLEGGTRASLLREIGHLAAKRGAYAGSREELTPVRLDWPSAIPATITALALLAMPRLAKVLPKVGWGRHLLTAETVRRMREMSLSLAALVLLVT